jgi:hypothetical protein
MRILHHIIGVLYNAGNLHNSGGRVTMKDEELVEPVHQPISSHNSTYGLLVRQSKKLGRVATNAFHDLKYVLNHEISMPSRDQLLNGLSRVSRLRSSKKTDELSALRRLVRRSQEVLISAHTVFPLTLFPHSIVMDRTKITIIKRTFFWSSSVMSIRVDDILNVSCDVGPLFGSVTIASRVMNSIDHFEVHYLWRGDAIYLKHIVQGYVFARQNNVDMSELSRTQLLETIAELGQG